MGSEDKASEGSALWFVLQILNGKKVTHPDYPDHYWHLHADGRVYIVNITTGESKVSAFRNHGWELYEGKA